MFKFNSDEIWVNYIKQILFSFNLPKCKVFNSTKELKEYFPKDKYIEVVCIIKNYKVERDFLVLYKNGNITPLIPYREGEYYQNITTKFNLYNNTYDTNTHTYLGEYLRFIRDYEGINLMSMYNCYNDTLLTDKQYKYILIPIKYNNIYSIALDGKNYSYVFSKVSDLTDIQTLFENNSINIQPLLASEENEESKEMELDKIYNIKLSSFKTTYQINSPKNSYKVVDTNVVFDYFDEQDLKLIVRLPLANDTNIVVLEGNYTYIKYPSIIQANYDSTLEDAKYNNVDLDNIIKRKIQLLEVNYFDNTIKPFSDKLFEYLFDNVILPNDKISKNIVDAKYKLGTYDKNYDEIRGTYYNIDRIKFLDILKTKKYYNKGAYDLLGYIDKDLESYLDDKYNGGK